MLNVALIHCGFEVCVKVWAQTVSALAYPG